MKIAIVGCAHIHMPFFAKLLKERPEFQVVSVWDADPEKSKKYAAELHGTQVSSPEDIWRDPEIPAVVIASETCRHRELVIRAARAGKHVFAEKPLGMNGAEAREIAGAVTASGKIFQTGYFMRGLAPVLFLKEELSKGSFGTVTRVRMSNCHRGLFAGYFDGEYRWMADPEQSGCGAYGDLGTHPLDILMWLFGTPSRAFASFGNLTGKFGKSCEEYGEGMFFYPDGMMAAIAAGWIDHADPVTFEICGTEGHAAVVGSQVFFSSSRVPDADGTRPVGKLPEQLPHAFALYLDALTGKNVPLVRAEEAAERNVVMDACYQSAREGRMIEILR